MAEPEKKDAAEAGGQEVAAGAAAGIPPKVDHKTRFLAMLIDGIISGVIAWIGAFVGGIAGAAVPLLGGVIGGAGQLAGAGYTLIRDSLNDGRSFGKKIMKLKVKTPSGAPCTQQESITRNMLLAAPGLFGGAIAILASLPGIGFIFALLGLAGIIVALAPLYEALQVIKLDPNGRRMSELKSQCYTVPE